MSTLQKVCKLAPDQARQGIYTDLDTLFDTRMAAIEEVDLLLSLTLLRDNWCMRVDDTAKPIPDEKYKELYDNRDINTLVKAIPTFISETIRAWCGQALVSIGVTPFPGYCEIFVNCWPYKLTKVQAREYADKLKETLGDSIKITMIQVDPKTITCKDAKLFFSAMFVNDWHDWLEARAVAGDIRATPIPDVTLYAPRVCRGSISQSEYDSIKNVDVFSTVEQKLMPVIGLEFLEVSFFSSVHTPDIAQAMIDKYLLDTGKLPT